MIFYLAGKYTEKEVLQDFGFQIVAAGHRVNSRWLLTNHQQDNWKTPAEAMLFCVEDLEDIDAAQGLVLCNEAHVPQSPGRNIEFGYALAKGKSVFLIGERSGVFHFHPLVQYFDSKEHFIDYLKHLTRRL